MIFSGLFKKKTFPLPDFSGLGADMHSHLIPGIDDGAKTIDESVELVKTLQSFGFKKLITTPHIMGDHYKNTPEIILTGLKTLRQTLEGLGIHIPVEAAAEYYYDQEFQDKIGKEELLTFGNRFILFEVSYLNLPESLYETVFKLISLGYRPVLAHPERYPFWWGKLEEYEKLKSAGVLLQVNLNSFSGYYGPHAKKAAGQLLDNGWIDLAGTDLHGARHLGGLTICSAMPAYQKLVASGKLLNSGL